jgi:paraquat-inducible protein A
MDSLAGAARLVGSLRSQRRAGPRVLLPDDAPIMACHECGLIHRVVEFEHDRIAECHRCGAALYRSRPEGVDHALSLVVAAIVLFVLANVFPFMSFNLEGRSETMLLGSGFWRLYQDGQWAISILILMVGILMPLARLLLQIYILLPLRFGIMPPNAEPIFRLASRLRPWAMTEIYLVGVIVAYVKLVDFAQIGLGVGLLAFAALIVVMAWADAALDPHEVWERLEPQATVSLLHGSEPGILVACHDCGQIVKTAGEHAHCPRCGAALHRRKPESLQRTWACLLAAAILYIPANAYPILTIISFGKGAPSTILGGVIELIQSGMLPIAAVVFLASVLVPVLKILGLAFLTASVQFRWTWRPRERTFIYRIIEGIGRWSMIDIFMISILVGLVTLGNVATIEPGPAATCFAGVVIITMIGSMSFDPRLIWDVAEEEGAARPALAV